MINMCWTLLPLLDTGILVLVTITLSALANAFEVKRNGWFYILIILFPTEEVTHNSSNLNLELVVWFLSIITKLKLQNKNLQDTWKWEKKSIFNSTNAKSISLLPPEIVLFGVVTFIFFNRHCSFVSIHLHEERI